MSFNCNCYKLLYILVLQLLFLFWCLNLWCACPPKGRFVEINYFYRKQYQHQSFSIPTKTRKTIHKSIHTKNFKNWLSKNRSTNSMYKTTDLNNNQQNDNTTQQPKTQSTHTHLPADGEVGGIAAPELQWPRNRFWSWSGRLAVKNI